MFDFINYPDHHVCESFNDVISMLSDLKGYEEISFDTETSGLSPYTSHIVGYAFGRKPGIGYYIPIRHYINPIKDKELDDTKQAIKDWLENTHAITKLFWNAKFDLKMLRREGISLSGSIHDGMLLLALTNKPLKFSKQSLKSAAKEVLGLETIGLSVLNDEKRGRSDLIDKLGYGIMSHSVVGFYAAEDAIFTYKLCEYFLRKLNDDSVIPPSISTKKETCSLLNANTNKPSL